MDDKWKKYTMIALTMALLSSLGYTAMPEATHYCESRELQAHCFSLSSTFKTCYTLPSKTGGKVCRDLWKEIPDKIESAISQSPYVIAYTDNGKWFCDKVGYDANCVKDDTLEMPFN